MEAGVTKGGGRIYVRVVILNSLWRTSNTLVIKELREIGRESQPLK